jgi:hypothetical protein
MTRRILITLALAMCALAGTAHALPPVYGGAQFRYWSFTDGNDMRDYIAYGVSGPVHVQLEYWDFDEGEDQFRPEVGLHLRDSRRSVYNFEWRHEKRQERFTIGTDQVLSDHIVGRVSASPIFAYDGPTLTVLTAGADYYWGSYNFLSATLYHDPRGDDLWVVPVRLRLANESNDWVQVTMAPASKRTLGWAFDFKYRWARAGVERNSRFDFTNLDNVIFTVGFEVPFPRPRE